MAEPSSTRPDGGLLGRPAPSGGRVLPQLDALRGVAILAVFVQHLGDRFMPFVDARAEASLPTAIAPWVLTVLHHAWWGVDLFFVLSGFSLAQGYLRAFERGRPEPAGRFLLRRAARILPGYLVAIAIVLASHPAFFAREGIVAALAAHLALLQGYVAPGGIVIIGATWSLTTEAHFYLALPLIARPLLARDAARPWKRALVTAGLCVVAWASRDALHRAVLEPGVRTALFEITQRRLATSRLDQFVLGCAAAAAHASITGGPRAARAARLAPFGVIASLVALVLAFRAEGALLLEAGGSWPYAPMSLATAALVLSATLCEGRALAVVAPRPLAALGVVSYGVFLYHQLALGIVGHHLVGESWATLAINGALGLALAAAMGLGSWVLVERPALRWAARFTAAPLAPPRPAPSIVR
jgi:peptidoglycan/LPS O-acetylase OafA/YrhL